jgi:hypothetical protein
MVCHLWINQLFIWRRAAFVVSDEFVIQATKVLHYFPLFRYAHYDNNPSFTDFAAFGGWAAPAVKQYAGDTTQCR